MRCCGYNRHITLDTVWTHKLKSTYNDGMSYYGKWSLLTLSLCCLASCDKAKRFVDSMDDPDTNTMGDGGTGTNDPLPEGCSVRKFFKNTRSIPLGRDNQTYLFEDDVDLLSEDDKFVGTWIAQGDGRDRDVILAFVPFNDFPNEYQITQTPIFERSSQVMKKALSGDDADAYEIVYVEAERGYHTPLTRDNILLGSNPLEPVMREETNERFLRHLPASNKVARVLTRFSQTDPEAEHMATGLALGAVGEVAQVFTGVEGYVADFAVMEREMGINAFWIDDMGKLSGNAWDVGGGAAGIRVLAATDVLDVSAAEGLVVYLLGGSAPSLVARVIGADGSVGEPVVISSTAAIRKKLSLVKLEDGYAVAYYEKAGSFAELYVHLINKDGTARGRQQVLSLDPDLDFRGIDFEVSGKKAAILWKETVSLPSRIKAALMDCEVGQ